MCLPNYRRGGSTGKRERERGKREWAESTYVVRRHKVPLSGPKDPMLRKLYQKKKTHGVSLQRKARTAWAGQEDSLRCSENDALVERLYFVTAFACVVVSRTEEDLETVVSRVLSTPRRGPGMDLRHQGCAFQEDSCPRSSSLVSS